MWKEHLVDQDRNDEWGNLERRSSFYAISIPIPILFCHQPNLHKSIYHYRIAHHHLLAHLFVWRSSQI